MAGWAAGSRAALFPATALTATCYGGFWMLTPALAGEVLACLLRRRGLGGWLAGGCEGDENCPM